MDRLELTEVRSRLQTVVEVEGRVARKPRFGLAGLWRRRAQPPAPPPTPVFPPPRRVGLAPESVLELTADAELPREDPLELTAPIDDRAEPETIGRRNGFGQRREPVVKPREYAPAPSPPPAVMDEDVGEALRRLGSSLSRASRAPMETPDLPEDYGASAATPVPPRRLILRRTPELDRAGAPLDPEVELLQHLERVFLAEHAGLEAHRLSA